ncbi:hypothetical protein RE474_06055 [Methanolobus sediminis]|uniref:Uncharacterized protein n=1 Tax=Methanolobus sediminis TaxID=3072978 RepID=A0AA51UMD5_9EURY|nr:hypothetical protein [Methanolobus sediminis]WMW26273.1 hypothetical protein RE474_06055 [Methanolobus sediminis]
MEIDNIIVLVSSILALVLFSISLAAYMRERRRKLLLVTTAFFAYFLMGFMGSTESFFPSIGETLEIWGSILNFVVLLLFFFAMVTKEKV